jgi:glycosyltransferase involved in cell wall biosynthesis
MPLITIITVTYNAEKYLERTIQSIIGQTHTDYEYLIVDGGSKDRTLEIVKQYEGHVRRWVSERDRGLYDAMNKGMRMATGDFIWFMNAGDEIYDEHVLARLAALSPTTTDVYYGDALFVQEDGQALGLRSEVTPHRLPERLHWRSMALGMVVCHQSFIVRRIIAPPYDDGLHPYSADVDWEIQCLKNAKKTVRLEGPISRYLTGGFSRRHLRNSLLDRFHILQKHFGLLGALKNHVLIALRGAAFAVKKKGKYW